MSRFCEFCQEGGCRDEMHREVVALAGKLTEPRWRRIHWWDNTAIPLGVTLFGVGVLCTLATMTGYAHYTPPRPTWVAWLLGGCVSVAVTGVALIIGAISMPLKWGFAATLARRRHESRLKKQAEAQARLDAEAMAELITDCELGRGERAWQEVEKAKEAL